nr:MAG TPA: hypothetical protein [Microviridae sp.]
MYLLSIGVEEMYRSFLPTFFRKKRSARSIWAD